MSRANRVVVLGSLNMDLLVRVSRLPAAGETILGRDFQALPGGKGANQAVAAARLGARVSMIGCVGRDANGRQLLSLARLDGVDVRHVRRVARPTGVAAILVDDHGQNVIAVVPGANSMVTAELVEAAGPVIDGADLLVAQLETPLEAITVAAARARVVGTSFLLNAAPGQPGLEQLLALTTILVVNETELSIVSGKAVKEGSEGDIAGQLLERGPRAVVVTLGSRGAVVVDAAGKTPVAAFSVEPVDSTGAGDAFVGALAARFAGIESLPDAAHFASAAGAIACTRTGAQPCLPRAEEVERLLAGSGLLSHPA